MTAPANPVSVRGVIYPSQRAAARAHGVTPATVRGALERGTIDNLGIGSNGATKKPVWVRFSDGLVLPFESLAAMGRWAKERPETTRSRMRRAREANSEAHIARWHCTVHLHNPKGHDNETEC